MKRCFLINFLCLISLSCSYEGAQDLLMVDGNVTPVSNTYFSDIATDYTYKTSIEVYGRYFSGIMVFKKVSEHEHRVVFLTEMGARIFDFSFKQDSFLKNYALKDLDRPIIINTLKRDFKALLQENLSVLGAFKKNGINIYKTQQDKRNNFYYFDSSNNRLDSIVQTRVGRKKVVISFDNSTPTRADSITITHNNIKLNIGLAYISSK